MLPVLNWFFCSKKLFKFVICLCLSLNSSHIQPFFSSDDSVHCQDNWIGRVPVQATTLFLFLHPPLTSDLQGLMLNWHICSARLLLCGEFSLWFPHSLLWYGPVPITKTVVVFILVLGVSLVLPINYSCKCSSRNEMEQDPVGPSLVQILSVSPVSCL